jgi:hypothetical protein
VQYSGIKKKGFKQTKTTLTGVLSASNKRINSREDSACICGHDFEDCIHFFFECPFCNENRAILFNKLENYI